MRLLTKISSFILLFFLISCNNSNNSTEESTADTQTITDTIPNQNNNDVAVEETPNPEPEPEPAPEPEVKEEKPSPKPAKKSTSPRPTKSLSKSENLPTPVLVKNEVVDPVDAAPVKETPEKEVAAVNKEPEVEEKPIEAPKPKKASHEAWDKLLRSYVSSTGKVNYAGFKSNKSALDAYLKHLEENPIESNWTRGEKMAYWINAYNAFTVKLIVDNYPLASITKLHGGKPWDVKWIKLGNKTYSLNNIENDILRPQYKDARIHFAVNCAAKSCPPLLNRAWTAANLNSNFEKQAKAFINNASFNKISADKVQISKIFEWYAGDFGNIITYLNKYANTKINPSAKVEYLEYNWDLNK